MAQRRVFDCDDCGHEIGRLTAPLAYLQIGVTEDGELDESAELPRAFWPIFAKYDPATEELQHAGARFEACAKCWSKLLKAKGALEVITAKQFHAEQEVEYKKRADDGT